MDKIMCANCKNLLSFGPVTLWEEKYYCGRCPKENGFVVTIFEELAKLSHFAFTCQYKENGCSEKFKFEEMKKHEDKCTKRKLDCPIESCSFQTVLCSISEHLNNSHLENFESNQFVIDLQNNSIIQKIIKYNDNLFLLNITNKYRDGLVQMHLRFLGINYSELYKKYRATFMSLDLVREFSVWIEGIKDCRDLEKSEENINLHMLNYALDSSSQLVCKITFEAQAVIKETVLKTLVCPICNDYLQEPIVQCSSGHSFCAKCTRIIRKCCYCDERFSGNRTTRNYALESISKEMVYPCKNAMLGCCFVGLFNEIKIHEKTCNLYVCPLKAKEYCNFGGSLEEVLKHCKNSHVCKLNPLQKVQCNISRTAPMIVLINAHEKIFKYYRVFDGACLYCLLMYVGPAQEASKYTFVLEIINKDEGSSLKFSENVKPLIDESKIQPEDCLSLQKELHLQEFLQGPYIYCNLSVEFAGDGN